MGIVGMFEKVLQEDTATAIPAIVASKGGKIAPIAQIAVAQPSTQENNPADNAPEHRINVFMARGIQPDRIQRIIKMLAARDATLDDRRSCAECSSYYTGKCIKRMQPIGDCDDIADVLHRCAGFSE